MGKKKEKKKHSVRGFKKKNIRRRQKQKKKDKRKDSIDSVRGLYYPQKSRDEQ